MDLVVFSPHLDDAALSVGATIAREAALGRKVCVATFFSAGPNLEEIPPRMRVFADYEVRKREDQAAVDLLGASPLWFDCVERAFRFPFARNLLELWRTPADTADFPNLDWMSNAIRQVLGENPKARVLAPLGVGNHFDHVEVAVASFRVMMEESAFDRFGFYEDVYATGTALRKQHFVTRLAGWSFHEAPDLASPVLLAKLCLVALLRRGPSLERYLPGAGSIFRWGLEPSPLGDCEQVKFDALACYETQWTRLEDIKRLVRVLRAYHRFWGGAEPLWRPLPGDPANP